MRTMRLVVMPWLCVCVQGTYEDIEISGNALAVCVCVQGTYEDNEISGNALAVCVCVCV